MIMYMHILVGGFMLNLFLFYMMVKSRTIETIWIPDLLIEFVINCLMLLISELSVQVILIIISPWNSWTILNPWTIISTAIDCSMKISISMFHSVTIENVSIKGTIHRIKLILIYYVLWFLCIYTMNVS